MMYNLTGLYNVSNAADLVSFANVASGGVLLVGFSIAFFVVVLTRSVKNGFAVGLASSCFVSLLLSFFLFMLGVLNWLFMVLYGLGLAFSLFYLYVVE